MSKSRENKGESPVKLRGRNYRRKQRSTSIYFLIWALFSALSLLIVFMLGFSQQFLLRKSYKEEASRDVHEKGRKIQTAILQGPPEWVGGNFNGYLRWLSKEYDVSVFILGENGQVLFPTEPNFDQSNPEVEELGDYSKELNTLKQRLENEGKKYTVYEGNGAYVYGSKIELYEDTGAYLYITRSLALMETVLSNMKARLILIAVFVFVLSFAVSSAASGWLTKPIREMTQKANRLAKGDFNVDFSGADYGREMVELAEMLNFARDELSKTDRMQKELIANVSHDFKTPLTMIKGYASMIMEISGEIPEKRNKHAQVIVDEADRLSSLVSDVLDLSKMRSGLEEIKRNYVDMSSYLHEILGRFAYLQETQGYTFITEIEEDLYTQADELKIGQVLYNLIGNAVNYTGEDKMVYVRLTKRDTVFRFSVTDTGNGIKQEELGGIWDRYYRSSEMHKRPVKGTGLGLSIVKTVLERHGFVFGVQSELGKGSTFFVDFPLCEEEDSNA